MAKKIMFMLLVLLLLACGAVASMATGEGVQNIEGALTLTGLNVPGMDIEDGQYIEDIVEEETYTYDKIIEEYDSLFFGEDVKTEKVFIKNIVIKQDNFSDDIHDHELLVTLDDSVVLEDNDFIVVMAFIKKDDSYEMLGTPMEVATVFPKANKFKLPFVGKEQPNCIRLVVFPRSSYDNLTLNENLQIDDKVITITEPNNDFSFWSTLKNSYESFTNIFKKLSPK